MIALALLNPFVAIAVTAGAFAAATLLTRPVPHPPGHADSVAALRLAKTARRFGAATASATFLAFAFTYAASMVGLGQPREYRWWQFPLPLAFTALALFVLLLMLRYRRTHPEATVEPVQRRDLWSFSDRSDLTVGLVVWVALVLTCVVAGSNSNWMTISFPSGGGYADFFGWAYGLPVLGGAILVAALAIGGLRANARPPYVRPETTHVESSSRRDMAKVIVRASTASMLIPLGGALIFIAGAASGRVGVGIPGVGDFYSILGFSSLTEPLFVIGRLCEVVGVVLLSLLLVGGSRRWRFSRTPSRPVLASNTR